MKKSNSHTLIRLLLSYTIILIISCLFTSNCIRSVSATNSTTTPATTHANYAFGFYFGSPSINTTYIPAKNTSSLFGYYYLPASLRDCSSGWNITGYFIPVEGDYSSPQKKIINVQGVGNISYNTDFLNDVLSEGWGKTKLGWYIGYWDNKWHKSSLPLTSGGQPLIIGTVQTDPTIIHPNSSLTISPLPRFWNHITYTAADFGGGLNGKRIAVYTGEGKIADEKTIDITGIGKRVCLLPETKSNTSATAANHLTQQLT